MNKRIILSVTNDLVTDQRVHKVATSLMQDGYEVTLLGRKMKDSLSLERNYKTKRFLLFFNKKVWFYAEYNIRLFFYLLFNNYDVYVSNDLDTLLPNFLVSKIKRKPLVYDSHELFCEVPELNERKFQKKVWQKIERYLLPKISNNITVCKSISKEYEKLYKTSFEVVRNVPLRKSKCNDKQKDETVLIYQGALNKDRGIELMIKSMKYIPNIKLWLIGSGDLDYELKTLTQREDVEDRVVFWGQKSFEKLSEITCKATIGLSLERDTSASYHFALPNKLFDYIQANIPVVVSSLPEMKRVVEDYGVGEVFKGNSPKDLADVIIRLVENKEIYNFYVDNSVIASEELIWEKEQKVYLSAVKKAIEKNK